MWCDKTFKSLTHQLSGPIGTRQYKCNFFSSTTIQSGNCRPPYVCVAKGFGVLLLRWNMPDVTFNKSLNVSKTHDTPELWWKEEVKVPCALAEETAATFKGKLVPASCNYEEKKKKIHRKVLLYLLWQTISIQKELKMKHLLKQSLVIFSLLFTELCLTFSNGPWKITTVCKS